MFTTYLHNSSYPSRYGSSKTSLSSFKQRLNDSDTNSRSHWRLACAILQCLAINLAVEISGRVWPNASIRNSGRWDITDWTTVPSIDSPALYRATTAPYGSNKLHSRDDWLPYPFPSNWGPTNDWTTKLDTYHLPNKILNDWMTTWNIYIFFQMRSCKSLND